MLAAYRRLTAWIDASRLRRWTRDALVLAAVFAAVTAWQTRKLPAGPSPSFDLPALDGGRVSLAELKGKKVLLGFWAPWCGVCSAQSHNLSALAEGAGDDTVVLTVATAFDDVAEVERYVKEHDARYRVLLDDDRVRAAFQVDSFPTLFVIDEEGRIEDAAVGYVTELGMRLRLWF